MPHDFLYDLKVARKRAGLTQADCGHLLGASNNVISQIELGQRMPTVRELCTLSVIYGDRFDGLYSAIARRVCTDIAVRLASLPDAPRIWLQRHARRRARTLERLTRTLPATTPESVCG